MSIRGPHHTRSAKAKESDTFLNSPVLVALLAFALAGAGIALLASPAAADTVTVQGDESIQNAIDQASPGDVINVTAGTYEEAVTIHENESGVLLEDLTLQADGNDSVTVDAGQTGATISIQAPGVHVRDLTVQNSGEGDGAHGIEIEADEVSVTDNTLQGGLSAGDYAESTINQIGLTVSAGAQDAYIADNTVESWRNIGIYLAGSAGDGAEVLRNTVDQNRWHGILIEGPDGESLEVRDNTIENHEFSALRFGVEDTTDYEIRDNDLALSNQNGVTVQERVEDGVIDVRWNQWGVVKEETIENTRINDNGTNNDIQINPYLGLSGEQIPPAPAVQCTDEEGNATAVETGRLTLQGAIDLALPDKCVNFDGEGPVERTIVLDESFEEYEGATVDTQVRLESNATNDLTVSTEGAVDFGARIQAQQGEPALRFAEGSQHSSVQGLGIQGEPVGTQAIIAEDIDADSNITVEDVGIGSRNNDASQGLVLRDVSGFTFTDSTILSGDPVVELDNTAQVAIEANRLVHQSPTTDDDATGIRVDDDFGSTVADNVIIGNGAGDSLGIEVVDAQGPLVSGNTIANVADGLLVNQSTETRLQDNSFAFSSVDLSLDSTAITIEDGADHVVNRNTFQFADVGLDLDGAEGVDADMNRFNATTTGVTVADLAEDELDGVDDLVINNASLAPTVTPLELQTSTENLDVDAECNDWGVYTNDSVETIVDTNDNGENNDVDAQPFTAPDSEGEVDCLTPPNAQFSWEVEEPITRLDEIQFLDESEEGDYSIQEWEWDFGDGTSRTYDATSQEDPDPKHQYDAVGTFYVKLNVSDTTNMTSTKVHEIEVENIPPEITPIEDQKIEHQEDLNVTVEVEDDEGDEVTYELVQLEGGDEVSPPPGMTLEEDGEAPTIEWNPGPNQDGVYDLRVKVDDSYDTASEDFELEVVNTPPEFDPELPDVLGGAVDRNVTQTINAVDVDELDEIQYFEVNLSQIPAPREEIWTPDEQNASGELDWNPDAGENGTYNISVTASSPGYTVSPNITLDIREGNAAPTIAISANDPYLDGDTAEVDLEAFDDEGDTINWSTELPDSIDQDNTDIVLQNDEGDKAVWKWDIPRNKSGSHAVEFVADDGYGDVSSTETIDVQSHPWVDDRLPQETETGLFTLEPLVGSDVLLSFRAQDVDGDLDPSDMAIHVDGQTLDVDRLSEVDDDVQDDSLYGATYEFTEPGVYEAEFVVTDADGNEGNDTLNVIDVQPNEPPDVTLDEETVWANSTSPTGVEVELSGDAEDPEGRTLSEEDFVWEIPGQATSPTGREVAPTLGVGTHHIDLVVTDPIGASARETVTVHVDDTIDADGALDAPQTDEGYYRVDPAQNAFEELSGSVTVLDDIGQGVDGAQVTGEVVYYGAEDNDVGMPVASFELSTDANGEATFAFEQEILGVQPTELKTSFLSAPGWHEIHLEASADSRSAAPLDDLENASDTIEYFVGPSVPPAGQSGAHAGAACYDGPASQDGRDGARDEARVMASTSGDTRTATPGSENVTEGAATFADQGGDCKRGYAQASLLAFDFMLQACYDSEASVHVNEASCPAAGDGIPLAPLLAGDADEQLVDFSLAGDGACYYDGQGAGDHSHVRFQLGEGLDTDRPDLVAAQSAIGACASGLTNGELPEGGSFLALTGTAAGDAIAVEVSTVPASDFATGQSETPGATGVQAEGACFHQGQGGEDTASVFLGPAEPQIDGPDADVAMSGLTACGNAALAGSLPGGGSHATFTATVAGSTVVATVGTVPVSAALTP